METDFFMPQKITGIYRIVKLEEVGNIDSILQKNVPNFCFILQGLVPIIFIQYCMIGRMMTAIKYCATLQVR